MSNPKSILRIPRKVHPEVKDRWDSIRIYGKSREKMVDFICAIGGYHGGYGTRYAVSFNVKAYGADVDADSLWDLLVSDRIDVGPGKNIKNFKPEHMAVARSLFDKAYAEHDAHLFDWGLEEAREGWEDSDTPYETWTGVRVEWSWVFAGRCGGHLVMTECEGINLECSEDDLRETLLERDPLDHNAYVVDQAKVDKLFIICVQNLAELNADAAASEVQYRAAWRLWVSFVEDELADAIKLYEDRKSLTKSAEVILAALSGERPTKPDGSTYAEDFLSICTLAGIHPKDE